MIRQNKKDEDRGWQGKEARAALIHNLNINLNMNQNTINSVIVHPNEFQVLIEPAQRLKQLQSPGGVVSKDTIKQRTFSRNLKPYQTTIEAPTNFISYERSHPYSKRMIENSNKQTTKRAASGPKKQRSDSCIPITGVNLATELRQLLDSNTQVKGRNQKKEMAQTTAFSPTQLRQISSKQGKRTPSFVPAKDRPKSNLNFSANKKLQEKIAIYLDTSKFRKKTAPQIKVQPDLTKHSRLTELERYSVLLQQKIDELETEREFNLQLNSMKEEYQEICELSSSLSKDRAELKKRESKMFENYIKACEEKQKILVDSKLEISHERMKIKLLQETLKKSNKKFETLQTKNKQSQKLIENYESKATEATELTALTENRIKELDPTLDLQNKEQRFTYIGDMLKKYISFLPENHELCKLPNSDADPIASPEDSDIPMIQNLAEKLFPTQLKSYYASCEFQD